MATEPILHQSSPNTQQPDCDADAALARARRETTLCRARQCRLEASVAGHYMDAATTEAAVATWYDRRAALLAEAEKLERAS